MSSDYEIGTALNNMTSLDALTIELPDPYGEWLQYAAVESMSDGSDVGTGWCVAKWTFAFITVAQREQLREYCPAASAQVYIRTRTTEKIGSEYDAFLTFLCNMHWQYPEDKMNTLTHRYAFIISFTDLVLIPEDDADYLY